VAHDEYSGILAPWLFRFLIKIRSGEPPSPLHTKDTLHDILENKINQYKEDDLQQAMVVHDSVVDVAQAVKQGEEEWIHDISFISIGLHWGSFPPTFEQKIFWGETLCTTLSYIYLYMEIGARYPHVWGGCPPTFLLRGARVLARGACVQALRMHACEALVKGNGQWVIRSNLLLITAWLTHVVQTKKASEGWPW
jgi:hypothetical protein